MNISAPFIKKPVATSLLTLALALSARHARRTYLETQPLSNRLLLVVVLVSLLAQLSLQQLSATRRIFQIEAFSAVELVLLGGWALLPMLAVELRKVIWRLRARG